MKSVTIDIENKHKPGTRDNIVVHTQSISVFLKPKINVPAYQFDYKTDIGLIGKSMSV